MASVTYDDRSFLLDGSRVWLVSGAVHYFRIPEALWRDRLLKAKRAGLNCISTPVPWNFHEPNEGQWELTGERDVVSFVKLAGELGLFVILQPGPYVGADWDFGGLPGWLSAKPSIAYRTSNAAYTHYYDKYFRQVLTRLADQQVTRGGSIILVQNENEYLATTMPERQNYLQFVSQLIRRSGFEVPIISSNFLSDPPLADSVECVKAWSHGVQRLKQLRRRQSRAPLLVSAFWCGRADRWGGPHQRRGDDETARRAMELLGCGAQLDYYLFCGGTNFGFWAGRSSAAEAAYATTSYDYDAPVAEGGGLTPKYYFSRLVNTLASTMGPYIAPCAAEGPGATVHDRTGLFNLRGPAGGWAVVTNNGRSEVTSVRLSTPSGVELDVSLLPFGAAAVPLELALGGEVQVDYSNLSPLGFFAGKVLVLHGPPGWTGKLSVNGKPLTMTVPKAEELWTGQVGGLKLLVVSSELAMRTWWVDDSLVFGPRYVGQSLEERVDEPGAKQYAVLPMEGELSTRPTSPKPHPPPRPALSPWKRLAVCTEPGGEELSWTRLDRPRDADFLGVRGGYVWYRLTIQQTKAQRRSLILPDCEDRAWVYLNGDLLGAWGRGPGAAREPLDAPFRRGDNELTLLVDNLGRFFDEPNLGQLKGLFGPVYEAKPLPLAAVKFKPYTKFTRRMVPRQLVHLLGELEGSPVWAAEIPVSLGRLCPVHLSLAGLPNHLALSCNERQMRLLPRAWGGENFGDVTLSAELTKGRNVIRVLLWGDPPADLRRHLRLYALPEEVSQGAAWSCRAWSAPSAGGRVVGKDRPAWYVCHFKHQGSAEPLFLRIAGARKGQVFLNGHNVGRFWTVGPQEHYYLPGAWLKEQNELLLFEEQGLIPARSSLEYRPLGPYRQAD